MSSLSSHVLELSTGRPAESLRLELFQVIGDKLSFLGAHITNADGRVAPVAKELESGDYLIKFETGDYYRARGLTCFYPVVEIRFTVDAREKHYHVPLLLSPWGFSTYRGS